jgi:GT2 family glycosyltransferase
MDSFVSIVIVNFNGLRFLEPCLSSLGNQSFKNFEIILVDNHSADGSARYIREHFPSVTLIETGKNLGFAGGANAGIRASRGEYILTLNNDTIADPKFIENLVGPMASDPRIGMCASKMLFPDGRINSTGICISRSGAAWDRGIFERDSGQYDAESEVFGPCAGAALYRRSMLDETGIFDEDFFIFMEDVDLAFRARTAGWECWYIPTALVTHLMGGTAGVNSDLSVFYGNRNLLWNVIKNFPARTLLICLPWIVGRNCADIPYYLSQGKGWVIFRAKASALAGILKMIKKRENSPRKVPEEQIRKWIHTWMNRGLTHLVPIEKSKS